MGHKGHFRMYEFIGADGTTQKKRLCVRVHQEQIDALKATRVATSQPGQRQITGMTQAHAATPTATATVVTGDVPPGVGIIYGDIMLHHRVDR